jgi:adenine deaminase
VLAIQAATVAPAEYLGLRHDIGSIAPGRFADILFVADLSDFRPHRVLADGTDIGAAESGGAGHAPPAARAGYPPAARRSVRLPAGLSEADLRIPASGARARVRAIGMVDRVVPTEHLIVEVPVRCGEVTADRAAGLAKIALVNRHGREGKQVALGFVGGLGLTGGAVAQSTARDTHHLLMVGMNDADMIAAGRAVAADGGGIAVVRGGQVLARLPLPIAGLLSEGTVEDAAAGLRAVACALGELGCAIEQPTTMLAMLAVSAIPELRIGNRGLIDSRDYRLVSPVVS